MKMKSQLIVIGIIILCIFAVKANAETKLPIIDSTCCKPDSLKVVSTNYPVFCVSWQVSTDTTCKRPYGFEVQWRPFPSASPWYHSTVIYTGGTVINFCDSIDSCTNYQWRVRTICDTAGVTTYSDWVYGNKFAMTNCLQELHRSAEPKNKEQKDFNKSITGKAIKPKEINVLKLTN